MINSRDGQTDDHPCCGPRPEAVRYGCQKSTGYQSGQTREEGQSSANSVYNIMCQQRDHPRSLHPIIITCRSMYRKGTPQLVHLCLKRLIRSLDKSHNRIRD